MTVQLINAARLINVLRYFTVKDMRKKLSGHKRELVTRITVTLNFVNGRFLSILDKINHLVFCQLSPGNIYKTGQFQWNLVGDILQRPI